MASLVLKGDALGNRVIKLNLGANRIGRGPENEFQIDHPTVSPRHCRVILAHDGVKVRDCASSGGTFVDGRRVKEARLSPGQTLRLGKVDLLVESADVPIEIPRFAPPRPAALGKSSDQARSCERHHGAHATHQCTRCGKAFCAACVRRVRPRGGRLSTVCTDCNRPCEAVCSRCSAARAIQQCTQCRKLFCADCVSKVRRAGGRVWRLCQSCTRDCLLICPRHPELRAFYRCTHCGVAVCPACARFSRRRAGPRVRVCPYCRHPCHLMCASHPEEHATHVCTQCRRLLCPACVQLLRSRTGQLLTFCCQCDAPCVPVRERVPKEKSFFDRLEATVMTAFGRKPKRSGKRRSTKSAGASA